MYSRQSIFKPPALLHTEYRRERKEVKEKKGKPKKGN
jgi:hypothetical protein